MHVVVIDGRSVAHEGGRARAEARGTVEAIMRAAVSAMRALKQKKFIGGRGIRLGYGVNLSQVGVGSDGVLVARKSHSQ